MDRDGLVEPMWVLVDRIDECGWYWMGGEGLEPCTDPTLRTLWPRRFYTTQWVARAQDPVLPKKKRPDLKMDDPVLVSDSELTWYKRHFAGWDSIGRILCWNDGKTSFSAPIHDDYKSWNHWKLPEDNCG